MPSEIAELIVQFNPGVDEATAQRIVASFAGTVRRRMRADSPDEVVLLVRVPKTEVDRRAQEAANHPQVRHVEINSDGFSIR